MTSGSSAAATCPPPRWSRFSRSGSIATTPPTTRRSENSPQPEQLNTPTDERERELLHHLLGLDKRPAAPAWMSSGERRPSPPCNSAAQPASPPGAPRRSFRGEPAAVDSAARAQLRFSSRVGGERRVDYHASGAEVDKGDERVGAVEAE